MAKRKIIKINEDLCNGCGNCIVGCAEGALELVNGKAKLVKESFCDGFGDCIGTCPTGALEIIEKESEQFDFDRTIEHVRSIRGEDGVENMKKSHAKHAQNIQTPPAGGCPGRKMMFKQKSETPKPTQVNNDKIPVVMKSEITQWPLQLHLIQPQAPFLMEREMVLLSTCSPVTSPDVHWRYIRGRSVAIACPKLDRTEGYIEKLSEILKHNKIPRLIVLRMEVPCCSGLTHIVQQAATMSGMTETIIEEVTMSLEGEIIDTKVLSN